MSVEKRDLILICGVPAMGKTCYANKFANHFGFVHYDLEEPHTLHAFASNPSQFIATIVSRNEHAVVTWGFVPDHPASVAAILQFRASGFKLVWFDGDRQAALKRFQERAKANSSSKAEFDARMSEFDLQMRRIECTKIVNTITPAIIDPLDNDGQFKPPENLLEEIRKS